MRSICLLLILFAMSGSGFAQTKLEKEVRIRKKEVPKVALSFIDAINFTNKIKWYKETGLNKTSIEAKTKYRAKNYSIEFTLEGILEDVEIGIKQADIPQNTFDKMDELLTSEFTRYLIDKVQIQYVGAPEALLSQLRNEAPAGEVKINYELVIVAKVNRVFKKYEYLFSENGEVLRYGEIIVRNTDQIEY